ncbi:MAG: 3D domain-containing protein [Desulfosporosinus sp.]|jgi:3D (Asp-Asp-Asp) domain-containing protein
MYSLPINTYLDYWRAAKHWSVYLGGLAVFAAGSRYSVLNTSDMNQMIQSNFQQTAQSLDKYKLESKMGFLEPGGRISNQDTISRGIFTQGTDRRGVSFPSEVSRGLSIRKESISAAASQGVPGQKIPDQEVLGSETVKIASKIEVVDLEIPFDTQYIESDKLPPGKSEVQEKGEKGILRKVVKTFEREGQITDQQVLSSFEFKSPKKEVILRNSKPVPKKKVVIQNSSPAANKDFLLPDKNIKKTLKVEATAYTYTGNKTATGIEPREGVIAVDPKVIAMGSKVYVEGYGYAIAADTGGAIRGNRIDVFFPTLRQCINWGRKSVQVYVLQPN